MEQIFQIKWTLFATIILVTSRQRTVAEMTDPAKDIPPIVVTCRIPFNFEEKNVS